MSTGLHKDLEIGENHRIQCLEYASTVAREGAIGLLVSDVGRVARQTDDGTFWVLTSHSPVTWRQFGSSAPPAHHTTHEPSGSDPMAVDAAAATGSLRTLGTASTSACAGNDARLSDARTPTAHATSHKNGGSDEIATATAAANAIPKAAASGKLDLGWVPVIDDTVHGNRGGGSLHPVVTTSVAGFMSDTDKIKLDNIVSNGTGDDWVSGLVVSAPPSNDQTVDYTSGSYMINGVLYSIPSGGNYDLMAGYGGVNHYTPLAAGQRAVVLLYVDTAQVMKSVAGAASSSSNPPMPTIPNDVASLAFILISKHSNGSPKNITPSNITDCRHARRATSDEAVKISNDDTTSDFLINKLSNNGGVNFTKENADANETLRADVVGLKTATTTVATAAAAAPSTGQVLTATSPTAATWQTPAALPTHATSHKSGGADAIKLDELAAPTDVTTLNASSSVHGLLKKLSNVATEFMNGQGNWATPSGGGSSIFGADYQIEVVEGTSTTTSDTMQDKVTLTTPVLTGTYRVSFFCEIMIGTANARHQCRLYNVTDAAEMCFGDARPSASMYEAQAGFQNVTFAGAAKTFKVQFASQGDSATVTIRRARLELWRVS